MNTDNVSLIEVLAAARRQHASLVVESSGYLLLAISRGMGGLAVDVDPAAIMLRTDGALTLSGPRARCAAAVAAHTLRQLAVRLLDVSIGKSNTLRAAVRPPADDRNPLDRLITGVTKALIPINRGAAKRALARLARETIRAKKRGQLRPEDIQREAEETRAACSGEEPPKVVAPAVTSVAEPPPNGLSELEIEVELDLVTPTPAATELPLELRTVTPAPTAAEPFFPRLPIVTAVSPGAGKTVANDAAAACTTPMCSDISELHDDVYERVTATDPDDFAARAAEAHEVSEAADLEAAISEAAISEATIFEAAIFEANDADSEESDSGDLHEEPKVLEDFKMEEDEVDAELESDVSNLVACALKQLDDCDIAGADFSPLQASVAETPPPSALSAVAADASVESMLAGFGVEGPDGAVNEAANSLNEMVCLDVPEPGREISFAEKQVIAKLNVTPSPVVAIDIETDVSVELHFDDPSQPPALPRAAKPREADEEALVPEVQLATLSVADDAPPSVPRAYIHGDSWLGGEPDTDSEGGSIPPMFVTERPRTPRTPLILSTLLLLTGLLAAGVLWKKPEVYQQLKTMGSDALTTPAAGICYAPLAMRDLPAQHEVLLHLGDVGTQPLSTLLPTGVRLELVVTSTKHQATRVVVAADDEWSDGGLGLQHVVNVELPSGVTASWPAASVGEVGGVGVAGQLVVDGNVAGAEVWLVVNAGVGDSAQISVPCDRAARLLVVDTSASLRQRQLHVQPALLRAAARSGGAELSGKL